MLNDFVSNTTHNICKKNNLVCIKYDQECNIYAIINKYLP